jgi:Tol biopolymer transport system component
MKCKQFVRAVVVGVAAITLGGCSGGGTPLSLGPVATDVILGSTIFGIGVPAQEIVTVRPDGSGLVNLTNNPADDITPIYSPDGRTIAFSSNRSGLYKIYLMGSDGTNVTQLTRGASNDRYPSFSPDGRRMVFSSDRDAPPGAVTSVGHEKNSAARPRVLEPGRKPEDIYQMNLSNGAIARLTTNPADDRDPQFDPIDGTRIVFVSERGVAHYEDIYIMDSTGANVRQLTNTRDLDVNPDWRPDGQKILVGRILTSDVFPGLVLINPDGTGMTVVPKTFDFQFPTFNPDATRIAFGAPIGTINVDGSNGKNLLNESGERMQIQPGDWR